MDLPFEPEYFSLVVDKGTLDCVGMSRREEPENAFVEPGPELGVLWAESVFRSLAAGGFLVVLSCCFLVDEVVELVGKVDVLGCDEYILALRTSEELQADNGSTISILVFQKQNIESITCGENID